MYYSAFIAILFAVGVSSMRPPCNTIWLDTTTWTPVVAPTPSHVDLYRPCPWPMATAPCLLTTACGEHQNWWTAAIVKPESSAAKVLSSATGSSKTTRLMNTSKSFYTSKPSTTPKPSHYEDKPYKTVTRTTSVKSKTNSGRTTTMTTTRYRSLVGGFNVTIPTITKTVTETALMISKATETSSKTHGISESPSLHGVSLSTIRTQKPTKPTATKPTENSEMSATQKKPAYNTLSVHRPYSNTTSVYGLYANTTSPAHGKSNRPTLSIPKKPTHTISSQLRTAVVSASTSLACSLSGKRCPSFLMVTTGRKATTGSIQGTLTDPNRTIETESHLSMTTAYYQGNTSVPIVGLTTLT
jgi:hypothetical protein